MAWHGVTMEMPRCVQLPGNPSEISVFERQQMRLKSQHQQQQTISRNSQAQSFTVPPIEEDFPKDLQLEGLIHLDGWPDMLQYPLMGSADQLEHPSSNFGSGSTTIDGNSTTVEVCSNGTYVEEMNRNGLRKRKTAERAQTAPLVDGSDLEEMKVSGEKRAKCEVRDGGAVLLHQGKHEVQLGNGKSRKTTSKDNLKPSSSSKVTTMTTTSEVVQKSNYIHVRARRGQATDSHSLAERARREKISERMKYLQDLVPGCNKITGKAGMLDEIINYVQSLQRQVEFLSMKLAAANPVFDFGSLELSILKENASACSGGLPVTMAILPDLMSSSPLSSSSMVPTANPINGGLGLALNLQDVQLNHTSDPAIALSNYNVDVHNFHVAGANCSPTWDATPQKVIPVNNFGTMPAVPITKLYHGAT